MNKNTAGAALVLIIAAAGLVTHEPAAWGFAAFTCALAFLCEEMRDFGTIGAEIVRLGLALASWATIAIAAFALLI